MSKKQVILNTVSDLCIDFLVYNRKEDEELGRGEIEEAIKSGEITVDEIVNYFKSELEERLRSGL